MNQEAKNRKEQDRAQRLETLRKMDKYKQIRALERVRDNPNSTPGEVLEAVRLIEEIGRY